MANIEISDSPIDSQKRADRLNRKAGRKRKQAARKEKRADKAEAKGKTGRAAILRGKAKKKTGKAEVKEVRADRAENRGKNIKAGAKKAAKGARGKVKDAKDKAKRGAKAKIRETKDKVKARINKAATAVAGATAPPMYNDGPAMADSNRLTGAGSEGDPGLGRMSEGPAMKGYGKISYGNHQKPNMDKGNGKPVHGSPFNLGGSKLSKHFKK